ncbi:MAG: DEAD/DEAH box helicase [Cyanobacteria bacterium CRU_2_1]|nr:DEAD/DEAH box helicase [Cyanobacteria bacterium RU_5_0]NJR57581.1 DEAD/DEAH box helicase [Cyanobacteria bacterium CRU_2_1]
MAILHGSWIRQSQRQTSTQSVTESTHADDRSGFQSGYFFIWGEIWRRVEPIEVATDRIPESTSATLSHPPIPPSPHPLTHSFAITAEELAGLLRSLCHAHQLNWTVADFPLDDALTSPEKSRSRKRKLNPSDSQLTPPHPQPVSPRWHSLPLILPTYQLKPSSTESIALIPQHSAAEVLTLEANEAELSGVSLYPWQVQGIRLTCVEALQLLQSLPLSSVQDDEFSWLGADLRFWSHVARWQLDLLARVKFLPGLERASEGAAVTRWQVLIDSAADQARLEKFARQMPGACRTYGWEDGETGRWGDGENSSSLPIPFASTQEILLSFLNAAIDSQARSVAARHSLPTAALPKDIPLREWLQALGDAPMLIADPVKIDRLESALTQWIAPFQRQLSQQLATFRTCFYLYPPDSGQMDWTLEYFLQAVDDSNFLVSARTVWHNPVERLEYMGRTIDQPQETLLAGLGLASRLYPVIEPSLQVQQPQSCKLNPLQVYEFIKSMAWRLQDSGFGVILPPSLANQEGWANRLGLRVQAETLKLGKNQRLGLQSLLNFKWELTIGGQRLSKAEFDRLVALNAPLVEINGEWVEFRSQDVKAAQAFFESRKEQMSLSLEDALRISTGDTQMIEKLPVVGFEASGALQELINTLTKGNQSVESIPTPELFRGELRPYQIRGVSWLAFLERWGLGACLADDMGLGKTPQLIALLLHLQQQDALEKPTLLVCPTSVLGNWEREVKRFAPSLTFVVHHGDKRSQGKSFAKAVAGKHLVITSYSLVHRDAKDLQSVSWQGIVLDEAQNIKNADSKQSQAVRQLDCQFRIALTGTPVENRLAELWSILDFLNPGYLGPKNFFQRRFAVPIERYGDTASLKTLRSLVQPFILRRLKTDRSIIQDLPEKQEMTVFCGLTADQATLYQKLVEHSLVEIESAEGIQRRGMILALLVKLKQVCNHPALFKDEGRRMKDEAINSDSSLIPHSLSFRSLSGKLQRLEEMLEEVLAEGDRSLIFTQFAEWGKLLQPYLSQRFNREVLFLYGSSSKKQREEMIDRFQNDPQGPRIFILSLKAGGVGLNLTRANHVFHFDRWWNPAVENQATDRVFRIGQTRNVQVHKFVCTGTLEERIHELIESKKALSEQVVGAGENWLTELDTDALRSLLLLDRAAVIDDDEG